MRQRTLGILAAALLAAGGVLEVATVVVAYRTAAGTSVPAPAQLQPGPRRPFAPGQRPRGNPGFGVSPGSGVNPGPGAGG
jgi:hypothetical protein